MNTWKFVRSIISGRPLLVLLTALLLVVTQTANPALGLRPGGDPTDTDPIGVGNDPPEYVPPAGGFSWAMEKRFGPDNNGDGMVDYHWTPDGYVNGVWVYGHYDPAYVYPTSWKINLNGCQTGNDKSSATRPFEYDYDYDWTLDGTPLTTVSCRPTLNFTDKATHMVGLTVIKRSDDSTTVFPPQTVQVKDYFIVSLGDSYASGQGNPDIEQEEISGPFGIGWIVQSEAQWQDERCHRSANAAPALAALALEASDPHSSVTFISFACTGATIQTPSYDLVPQIDADPLWEHRGSGILGPQRGEITDVEWGDYDHYIKPQMQQLEEALAASNGQSPRQIDALLISGGGNDMMFGPLIKQCIYFTNCWVNWLAKMQENPIANTPWYTLYELVTRAVGKWTGENPPQYTIPGNYADLGVRINNLNPKPLHVYVTQYPDPTINDRGVSNEANETSEHHCRMLDDVLWPNPVNVVTDLEAQTASHHAQQELNEAVRNSVATLASTYTGIDWQFVDGLSVFDVDPDPDVAGKPGLFKGGPNGGPGHGYCATDNWIRRADESELIQGPANWRAGSVGTMHPTYSGQQAIKSRILRYMLPDLTGQAQVQAPSFSFSYSSDGLTSQPGLNGWYLRSCDSSNNCLPRVVGQAVATSAATLTGASISVNDTGGCAVEGVSCSTTLSTDKKQVTYKIQISATGIYRLRFTAQDANGQSAFLQKEIKVDLEDPVLATPVGPFEVDEGGSVVVSASIATNLEGIPLNDDVLVNYDWDLDNDGLFETENEQPIFSAATIDGPAALQIQVRVTDLAGRTATAPSRVNVLNVTPDPVIGGAPASSYEGIAIDLTSTILGSGEGETFTYAWEVKKDGAAYKNGSADIFSFTPDDNGSYEVSLSVTDVDGDTGTTSETIAVTNVAPTATFTGAPASSPEGTVIQLAGSATDPGADDSLTYNWTVKKDGSSYGTGAGASYSFTPTDNGSYEVSLTVTDDDGGVGTADSQTIGVLNVAPALDEVNYGLSTISEGGSVTVSGGIGDPGTNDTLTLEISWGDGSTATTQAMAAGTTTFSASHTYADDNPSGTPSDGYIITVRVTDKDGASISDTGGVTVNNLAPTLTISAPGTGALYTVNSAVNLSASLTDPSSSDTLTCSVNWADGQTTSGTVATGVCTASHAYLAAGVYTVQVTGADDDLGLDMETVMVVVYDPSAGFVTGGGWINSPAGAYKHDASLSGKATFGFVSKYQKGSSAPTGNTAFKFQTGGFEFDSMAYEWLVVNQAGTNAQYKGTGMVNETLAPNGQAYKFMLWAGDGTGANGADTFRIRVWWEDAGGEHDVYDNGVEQATGSGNIVVHTGK